jgi:mevalonate kinase
MSLQEVQITGKLRSSVIQEKVKKGQVLMAIESEKEERKEEIQKLQSQTDILKMVSDYRGGLSLEQLSDKYFERMGIIVSHLKRHLVGKELEELKELVKKCQTLIDLDYYGCRGPKGSYRWRSGF